MHSQAFSIIEQQRNQSLTYFEFSTLAALLLFQQADLDVIILEVGLGGRLDATNNVVLIYALLPLLILIILHFSAITAANWF